MKSIEESVVIAMDGPDKGLFPFLPYIFQDLWEIGADPEVIIKKQEILQQISSAGMQLIEDYIINRDYIKDSDEFIFNNIKSDVSN